MRVKMSKPPQNAPIASAIGPCPTVIKIVGRPGTGSLPSTIAPPDHPRLLTELHMKSQHHLVGLPTGLHMKPQHLLKGLHTELHIKPQNHQNSLYESTHMNPDSFSDINQSSHDIRALSVYEFSNIATESVQSFPATACEKDINFETTTDQSFLATICEKDTDIHLQFDSSFPADTSGKERETSYLQVKPHRQKEREKWNQQRRQKKGRPSMCPLPICNRSTRKLKEHATLHFPTVLRENTNLEFEESKLQNLRHRSLET